MIFVCDFILNRICRPTNITCHIISFYETDCYGIGHIYLYIWLFFSVYSFSYDVTNESLKNNPNFAKSYIRILSIKHTSIVNSKIKYVLSLNHVACLISTSQSKCPFHLDLNLRVTTPRNSPIVSVMLISVPDGGICVRTFEIWRFHW